MSSSTTYENGRRIERKGEGTSIVRHLLEATPLFILIAALRASRRPIRSRKA